jgi:hypothetical protein
MLHDVLLSCSFVIAFCDSLMCAQVAETYSLCLVIGHQHSTKGCYNMALPSIIFVR